MGFNIWYILSIDNDILFNKNEKKAEWIQKYNDVVRNHSFFLIQMLL